MARSDKGKGKHVDVLDEVDEYALPPPLNAGTSTSPKKSKKHALQKSELVHGASGNNTATAGQRALSSSYGNFKTITATSRFPLAPIFALDSLDGVRQCLQSWTMRYVPSIDGVLVSFVWPPEILQRNAPLAPSSAYTLIHARWTGTVFRPQIGAKTTGRLSLATPSTISLLLHNLFNASISADQIPKDKYEWDPDARLPYSLAPAAANLQFGASTSFSPRKSSAILPQDPSLGAEDIPHGDAEDLEIHGDDAEEEVEEAELGCWVHKETREPLGGSTGHIEFTVIGLTIANSMISTHGSLLDDPLNLKAEKEASKSKKRKKDEKEKARKRPRQ